MHQNKELRHEYELDTKKLSENILRCICHLSHLPEAISKHVAASTEKEKKHVKDHFHQAQTDEATLMSGETFRPNKKEDFR